MSLSAWLRALLQPDSPQEPAHLEANAYPYPELLPLLQRLCTPAEYKAYRAGADDFQLCRQPAAYPDYWAIIPRYTYAECPFCHTRYAEPADTYHLGGWRTDRYLYPTLYIFTRNDVDALCPHFVGVAVFLNLHRHHPEPTDQLWVQTGEVPYLTPRFFRQEVMTCAVLHALPVCRIEAEAFVPRYTVFLLTHFSADPEVLLQRVAAEIARLPVDHSFPPLTTDYPGFEGYDLVSWAARGQLGWLDATQPELPLQMGPEFILPAHYQRIRGKRRGYNWTRDHFW